MEEIKESVAPSSEASPEGFSDSGNEIYEPDDIAKAIGGEDDAQAQEDSADPQAHENEGEQSEGQQLDYPVPNGFDSEAWNTIPDNVRGIINSREKAHADALSAERASVAQRYQETAEWAERANQQLNATMQALQQITEGEYSGINWQVLAQTDPSTYVKLQQGYQQRMQAINVIKDSIAQQGQQYQYMMQAQRERAIAQELNEAVPRMQALLGNEFQPQKLASDVANYLIQQGVPQRNVASMSKGYELEIATKAMLYDRMQAARSTAQKKITEAPVTSPSGRGDSSNSSRYQRAKELLNKNNSDNATIAALFEAM